MDGASAQRTERRCQIGVLAGHDRRHPLGFLRNLRKEDHHRIRGEPVVPYRHYPTRFEPQVLRKRRARLERYDKRQRIQFHRTAPYRTQPAFDPLHERQYRRFPRHVRHGKIYRNGVRHSHFGIPEPIIEFSNVKKPPRSRGGFHFDYRPSAKTRLVPTL